MLGAGNAINAFNCDAIQNHLETLQHARIVINYQDRMDFTHSGFPSRGSANRNGLFSGILSSEKALGAGASLPLPSRAVKHDLLATILVALLVASAVVAMGLSLSWLSSVHEMQELHEQAAVVNNSRAAVQALVGDVLAYSRDHPAMEGILQEFNMKQPGTGTTNQPATKSK
jgi:hypothetical protein